MILKREEQLQNQITKHNIEMTTAQQSIQAADSNRDGIGLDR